MEGEGGHTLEVSGLEDGAAGLVVVVDTDSAVVGLDSAGVGGGGGGGVGHVAVGCAGADLGLSVVLSIRMPGLSRTIPITISSIGRLTVALLVQWM